MRYNPNAYDEYRREMSLVAKNRDKYLDMLVGLDLRDVSDEDIYTHRETSRYSTRTTKRLRVHDNLLVIMDTRHVPANNPYGQEAACHIHVNFVYGKRKNLDRYDELKNVFNTFSNFASQYDRTFTDLRVHYSQKKNHSPSVKMVKEARKHLLAKEGK